MDIGNVTRITLEMIHSVSFAATFQNWFRILFSTFITLLPTITNPPPPQQLSYVSAICISSIELRCVGQTFPVLVEELLREKYLLCKSSAHAFNNISLLNVRIMKYDALNKFWPCCSSFFHDVSNDIAMQKAQNKFAMEIDRTMDNKNNNTVIMNSVRIFIREYRQFVKSLWRETGQIMFHFTLFSSIESAVVVTVIEYSRFSVPC